MKQAAITEWTNVRSAAYVVAHSVAACERCLKPTSLFCFGLLPGHERHIDDEWVSINAGVLLFHVEYLATDVIGVLQGLSTNYRLDHGNPTNSECWLNHCQHCGASQEDFSLHCEPDGAFLPTTAQAAEAIQFVHVHAPFAARAGGFSDALPPVGSAEAIG